MRLCFPTAVQSPLPSRGQAPFAHHGISGSSILSAVQRSASPVGLAPTSRIPIFFFSCTNKSKNSALICTDGGTRTPTHLGFLRDGCGNSTTLIPKLAACANFPLSSASFVFPKRLSRTGLARLPFVLSAEQPHCSVKR